MFPFEGLIGLHILKLIKMKDNNYTCISLSIEVTTDHA